MTAYDTAQQIIRETIAEFGGQAAGIEMIITDRIKNAGLKIEHRATTKKTNPKVTAKATSNPKVTPKEDPDKPKEN